MRIEKRIRSLEKQIVTVKNLWGVFRIRYYEDTREGEIARHKMMDRYLAAWNPKLRGSVFVTYYDDDPSKDGFQSSYAYQD